MGVDRSRFINNLFLFLIVVSAQSIQLSLGADAFSADATNVMVTAKSSEDGYSRWIALDSLKFKFKETRLTREAGKSPVTLWQFTNGNSFFQIIYNDGLNTIVDCEQIRQRGLVEHHIRKFNQELRVLLAKNNTSSGVSVNDAFFRSNNELHNGEQPLAREDEFGDIDLKRNEKLSLLSYDRISRPEDLPSEVRELVQLKTAVDRCEAWHKHMKEIVHGLESTNDERRENATQSLSRRKRAISDIFLAPNTRWCGKGSATSSYLEIGGHSRADKCCRKHDHCKMNIHGMSAKFRLFNYRPFTISHCNCDRRKRRDLAKMFIVPGTKWCGKGYLAKRYSEIGASSKADRCCRQHDMQCPNWIGGFRTKYHLFNWRINTLMHCKCDERFRTCLKMADSSDANLVGNLFFNVIKTKCFVLKPEKYCKQYNYLKRKCEKKGIRKRAHLRDNREF